nr:uncharacterized protein LOC128691985 [Cherax quadricarinatus]
MQFEGVPGEGLPVNMLENVNIQNENGCLTEESSVCKTVESLMKNTEAPMLSDITLKPEVKCNVQNCNSSVENFSKEVPILSGVEKEVALVKSCRTLSPTSIQTKKIHTKIKKSSLPVLRDTKCQTTWGRTGVLDVLGYHSKEKCSDKKSPNTVNVQDTDSILDNLPDSSETYERTSKLDSDTKVSKKYLTTKTEDTDLHWIMGKALQKLNGENINTTGEKTKDVITNNAEVVSLLKPGTDTVMCQSQIGVKLQFNKETVSETPQRLPVSRIPKTFQGASYTSSQESQKYRTARASSNIKSFKIPVKIEPTCTFTKEKSLIPAKKGSSKDSAKKGLTESTSKKAHVLCSPKTNTRRLHQGRGNLHNYICVEMLQETESQVTLQKSQSVGQQQHSNSGQLQSISDDKHSQCFPQNKQSHSPLSKELLQHSSGTRKHTIHNTSDTRIPIHLYSLKESQKSSSKTVLECFPVKAFSSLPRKGSSHGKLPVSEEILGTS